MTDPSPTLPALQRMAHKVDLFTRLSEFQAQACSSPPIQPTLPAVLAAAMPALQAGFSYTASHWNGELTVALHYQGAELGSSAPATPSSYSDTCARLLAGLLGLPLAESGQPVEPDLTAAPAPAAAEPTQPAQSVEPETAAAAAEPAPASPSPAADVQRPLSDEEAASAIAMIKAMPTDQRKAFTKAFREVFDVPPEAKQVAPFIQRLEHLHFIDRYTVEAAGGVAA